MSTTIQDTFTEDGVYAVYLHDRYFMSDYLWTLVRSNVLSFASPVGFHELFILENVLRCIRSSSTANMLYLTNATPVSGTDVTLSMKLKVDGVAGDSEKKTHAALVIGGNLSQNGYYYAGLLGNQFEIGYYNGTANVPLNTFSIGNQDDILNENYDISFSVLYSGTNSARLVLNFSGPTFTGSVSYTDRDVSSHMKGDRIGLYYGKTWGDIDDYTASFSTTDDSVDISFPSSPSETIISSLRKLNAVVTSGGFSTNNFAMIGGKKIRLHAINQWYYTIAAYIDDSPTIYDGDSAIIDGKVFDINKSGSRNAYCLSTNNTNGSAEPCRYMQIDSVKLPVNTSGDVIFAQAPEGSIESEEALFWMGRQMRFVKINGEWVFVINQ